MEDNRNTAAHNYALAAEDAAEATAAGQSEAAVTAAALAAAQAELTDLQALQQAGGALYAPTGGTLTRLDLVPGQESPRVAALLAGADTGCTLRFALDEDAARLATAATPLTVRQGSREAQAVITALDGTDAGDGAEAAAALEPGWQAGAATVELQLSAGQFAQCLPATALYSDTDGTFVYQVEERATPLGRQNVLVRIPVTVLAQGDGMAAVDGNLGDQIVTGADKPLAAGAWVRLAA